MLGVYGLNKHAVQSSGDKRIKSSQIIYWDPFFLCTSIKGSSKIVHLCRLCSHMWEMSSSYVLVLIVFIHHLFISLSLFDLLDSFLSYIVFSSVLYVSS